jgi:hypothetical protein
MYFDEKNILPSITTLEKILNSPVDNREPSCFSSFTSSCPSVEDIPLNKTLILTSNSALSSFTSSCQSDEDIPPNKTLILTSNSALSSYSQKFSIESIKNSSCQTVFATNNKSTNTNTPFSFEKSVQTFKTYHQTSRRTQTRKLHKKRSYSRKTQTPRYSVDSIRVSIQQAFPNSPLLLLNDDQFSRLITGNTRTPVSPESIL